MNARIKKMNEKVNGWLGERTSLKWLPKIAKF